jgi:peptidoglycan/xylan/chitin deacetylase (PgdA/CDA1 family)
VAVTAMTRIGRTAGLLALVSATSCTGVDDRLLYGYDDRRVVCSRAFDDYQAPLKWDRVEDQLAAAEAGGAAALFHAHDPGLSVSLDSIERLLSMADLHGLEYVTYDELRAGPPRPSIAIAFDDHTVEDWIAHRDILQRHGARVTYFITYIDRMTDEEHELLHELANDGNGIEAHTLNHLHARDYVASHGVDAYIADEVIPSITGLQAIGFEPHSFAYPYGEDVPEVTARLLDEDFDRVRVGQGSCPY